MTYKFLNNVNFNFQINYDIYNLKCIQKVFEYEIIQTVMANADIREPFFTQK